MNKLDGIVNEIKSVKTNLSYGIDQVENEF